MKSNYILLFFKSLFLSLCFLALSQCATGHCPREGESLKTSDNELNQRIWIYKYDSSKQCDPSSGLSLKTMIEKDFKNIKVWKSEKKHDGQIRVQFCGAYTGRTNRFLIEKKDLPILKNKGYEIWDFQSSPN